MDGAILCSYAMEQEYRWIVGLAVVDASHLIVLCRTDEEMKKHRIYMLTWRDGKLTLAWQVDGVGASAWMSPLYDQKYLLIGATHNNDIELWNIATKRIEKRYERRTSCFIRCAMVSLDKEYVIGADTSIHPCFI
jgi:hypothetical protein